MAKGAATCGVPKEDALSYAAAAMIGGSTLAGLQKLTEGIFSKTVIECIKAAYRRNIELGK